MNRLFQNLEKLKKESVKDYDQRINAMPPVVGGYAYFSPGNYDRQRERFGVFLVWNDLLHKAFKENQPDGGYYIFVTEENADFFLNKLSGIPVYVKLICQSGKIYPKELFVLKGAKHFKLVFNGCEVKAPEEIFFKGMEEAPQDMTKFLPAVSSGTLLHGSFLNGPFIGGSGYRFITSGLRLAGSGYRFATSGLKLTGSGYRFATSGLKLGGSGYRFTTSGLRLAGSGYRFTTSGLKLGGSGYRFTTSGLRLTGSGYRFATSGLRLTGSGYRFATSGLKLAGSGYSYTTSGLKLTGSGYRFTTSGLKLAGSGYRFTTSGLKLTGSGFRYHGSRRLFGDRLFSGSGRTEILKHTFDDAFYYEKDGLYIRNDAPSSYLEVDRIYGIGNLGYGLDLI